MAMEDFELLDHLGKGAFGTVIKVRRKSDRKIYAMKKVITYVSVDKIIEAELKKSSKCTEIDSISSFDRSSTYYRI